MTLSAITNSDEGHVDFYVSITWDDWPEGGSYTATVSAKDTEHAICLCKMEMASSRAEEQNSCAHCGESYNAGGDGYNGFCPDCADRIENGEDLAETGAGELRVYHEYSESWHVVDCFPVKVFADEHATYPKNLGNGIFQYAEYLFIWFDEDNNPGGADNSEKSALYQREFG